MLDESWTDSLHQRFLALWQRSLSSASGSAHDVLEILHDCYSEAHRRYHGIGHIQSCLEQLDLAVGGMQQPDEVELAIWFHDAVHRPGNADNEAESAALFRRLAGDQDAARVDRVCHMILDTTHDHPPVSKDGNYMVDIDLASLGQPWARFSSDSELIRAEQPELSDAAYAIALQRFLQALIGRPSIYRSSLFRMLYEQSARANIQRVLSTKAA
jgi:predicted metal-dependent HD superfamily phosphohydrolase